MPKCIWDLFYDCPTLMKGGFTIFMLIEVNPTWGFLLDCWELGDNHTNTITCTSSNKSTDKAW